MAAQVNQYKINPFVRNFAAQLVQHVAAKDWLGEMRAALDWVRANIRYLQDINGVETLQTPLATIQMRHGDCDDMCILLAAILEAIGFQTQFVAIALNTPGDFEHVFLESMNPDTGEMIALDPTENRELGWSAPEYVDRIEFPVTN